jgi:hypothetical protein
MGRLAFAGLLGAVVQACGTDTTVPTLASTGPAHTSSVEATITKTAVPYYRVSEGFDWTVEKSVTPVSLTLAPQESGVFDFVITATRTSTGTTGAASYGLTGQICVANSGTQPTIDLTIQDIVHVRIGGTWYVGSDSLLDVSANPVLDPGESHCYPYSLQSPADFVPNPDHKYRNVGKVYSAALSEQGIPVQELLGQTQVEFAWPTEPTVAGSSDATATVTDVLECPAGFLCTPSGASWTFEDSGSRPLAVQVKNVSATCGTTVTVVNEATLVENTSGETRGPASASGTVVTPDCTPPPAIHGCTPGYWKQKHHFDSWIGYTTGQDYDAVFGVNLFAPNKTLVQALSTGGGKAFRLGRHSVAALLNAGHQDVQYGMTSAQVIEVVQQAVASGNYDWASDQFEKLNELGCPLN